MDSVFGGMHAISHVGAEPVEIYPAHLREVHQREPAGSQQTEEQVFRTNVRLPETECVVARERQRFLQLRLDAGWVDGPRIALGEDRVGVQSTQLDDAASVGVLRRA